MDFKYIKDTVKKNVVKIISENLMLTADQIDLEDDDSLIDDGFIDSLSIIPLIEIFGNEFNIDIQSEELTMENWKSVNTIAGYIQEKMKS